ncbi:N-acetylmuramoyl-L-alanine amidase [Clostridium subterminale]|uniref:MurNAc-LAA domain-containing protein n=1 Tax=Clostridium subterminale TaxID=1550 RepID=A0ABN1KH17_CLOSU
MCKITLDPGHGGSDPGGVYGDLIEKDIALTIAIECEKELLRHGIEVQMTRDTDKYLGLSQRTTMANNNMSDYFISIHCNVGGGDRGEIVYSIYNGKGLELTNKISSEIMNIGQTQVKTYNMMNKSRRDYLPLIRDTVMDAIIIKCAFIDNEEDNKIISTIENQKKFGKAIAKGILSQLDIDYKDIEELTYIN